MDTAFTEALTEALTEARPGAVALLGSGETAAIGRRVLLDLLRAAPKPRTVMVLDTPAGFQPNAEQVAGKLVEFIATRLAEAQPIPRALTIRRSLPEADQRRLTRAILEARCIVAGPGSPTYTVRQLMDTPFASAIRAAHRRGSLLYFASAAAIAMGAFCLPVYEIFKAGMDVEWTRGLDLLGDLGLKLAVVPHWNTSEGGAQLDTRYCYMGEERFQALRRQLPDDVTILGIDEHTACVLSFDERLITSRGKGAIHILRANHARDLADGESLPLGVLLGEEPPRGDEAHDPPIQRCNIRAAAASERGVAARARHAERATGDDAPAAPTSEVSDRVIPRELINSLLAIRADLRDAHRWDLADRLRDVLRALGVVVEDTSTRANEYMPPMISPLPPTGDDHEEDERA